MTFTTFNASVRLDAAATAKSLEELQSRRKWPISYRSVAVLAMASDVVIVLFSGILSGALYHFEALGAPGDVLRFAGSAAVVAALFISLMKGHALYSPPELLALRTQIRDTAVTWIGVFLFLSGAVFALKIGEAFSRGAIFSFAVFGLGLLIFQRVFWYILLTHGMARQKFSGRNVVLITDHAPATEPELFSTLERHGFRLRKQFVLPAYQQDSQRDDDAISDIVAFLRGSDIEEVIVGADLSRWQELSKLFFGLRLLPLPINFIPLGPSSKILSRPLHVIGNTVCLELQRPPLDTVERLVKRTVDILCAALGLILLLPLLTVTAALIKLDSPGPILFRQRRCGFNGRPFLILKFRTMLVAEDGESVCQASRSDCRVTRLGKWLRRTSIDELPQLLNVLHGSMSLVGPRPHAMAHDNQFDKVVRNYAFRHHVKPGVTGWAQANGHRGATPALADIQRRVEYDLWYIDNWSFGLDCRIIIRTALEILRGRNAY